MPYLSGWRAKKKRLQRTKSSRDFFRGRETRESKIIKVFMNSRAHHLSHTHMNLI